MPIAIVLALAASLGIHAAALFGPDVELFGGADEPCPCVPSCGATAAPPTLRNAGSPPPNRLNRVCRKPRPPPRPKAGRPPAPATGGCRRSANAARARAFCGGRNDGAGRRNRPRAARTWSGRCCRPGRHPLRHLHGSQAFIIGRAEHRWEFTGDGRYRLFGMTETSGLVGLFKPVRFENESAAAWLPAACSPSTT